MDIVDMKLDWVSNASREALESVVIEYLFQLAGRQTRRPCLCARLRVVLRTFPNRHGLGSIISQHSFPSIHAKELFPSIIRVPKKLIFEGKNLQTHVRSKFIFLDIEAFFKMDRKTDDPRLFNDPLNRVQIYSRPFVFPYNRALISTGSFYFQATSAPIAT